MSRKSKRGAARYAATSRKGKKRHHSQTEQATIQSVAQPVTARPQPLPTQVAPPVPPTTRPRAREVVETRYLTAELKRIGILAGVMILALVILAFVLG